MVTCDDDFVGMGLLMEPGERVLDFYVSAGLSEVAGVDEDFSGRERGLRAVGVGYADYGYGVQRLGNDGGPPVVEFCC